MSDTPPGWFPDPFGRYERRYWDGKEWTKHVGTGNQQFDDPMGNTLSIPFATPSTATSEPTQQFAATPAPAAGDGAIPFLDRMGPDVKERPDPEAGLALAGIGGLTLAAGVLLLIVGDSEPTRGKLVLFGLLVFGGALALRLFLTGERYVRSAAVGAGVAGLSALVGAVIWEGFDNAWGALLLGAAFIAAWALPGFLGRPLYLGIGVLAVVIGLGQAVSDDSAAFAESVPFSRGVLGGQGVVFLILAILLLGLVFLLDRRGYHGVGTALVIPGLISTAIGIGDTVARIGGETGGTLVVIAAGVVICLVGAYGERRATTWIGAGVASIGVISFFFAVVEPDSPTSGGTLLLVAGAALIAAPIVVWAVEQHRADGGSGGSPANPPHFAPPTP